MNRNQRRIFSYLVGTICIFVIFMPETSMSQPSHTSLNMENAILDRDLTKVQRLVKEGADLEQPLFKRETPAIMAASIDEWPIVLFLLQSGADPAAKDAGGLTIATLARNSRLHPDAPEHRDLEAVRAILRERGLL